MSYFSSKIPSPIGALIISTHNDALCRIDFDNGSKKKIPDVALPEDVKALHLYIEKQLNEYFSGKRKDFELNLKPIGTQFQNKSWNALKKVSYGEKKSYSWQAKEIGSPGAMRAVGSANGRNPIPIILPCHRIVAKDGSLGGYSGGLEIKKYLLESVVHSNTFLKVPMMAGGYTAFFRLRPKVAKV